MKMSGKYKSEFEELGALGNGGFSTVFEARDIKSGFTYAIKKIPFTSEETERTLKEIKILSALNSDFVVSFIDSWIEDNYYIGTFDADNRQGVSSSSFLYSPHKTLILHIQMELCLMTLDQYIIKNSNIKVMTKEDYSEICDIFAQLLVCVNYLHKLVPPIIHRDLKPENIMLLIIENRYNVKVTDFGLSTYHNFVDESHTKSTGTVSYKAPEVHTKYYDTKADIYSLGKIMEKLLNFKLNSDSTENELEIQSKYNKARQICMKCIESEPIHRPDCQQILNEKQMWNYVIVETGLQNNNINWAYIFEKWHQLNKVEKELLNNCKKIAIIEELEEKSMVITTDGKTLALRVSDHIDSSIKEPKIISELKDHEIKSIECGLEHVLCLTKDMRVYSFGNNLFGQLGNGTDISNNKPNVIKELNDKKIIEVKCGAYHSLALSECGKLYSWGDGVNGQIGNGLNQIENSPVQINLLNSEKFISFSCGHNHCLAVSESGTLYGWGANECGQLGVGNSINQIMPVIVKFKESITIKKISCGRCHSLVLTGDNKIYSFGNNTFGELGLSTNSSRIKPKEIRNRIKFNDCYASYYNHLSIGADIDNNYYVWGECKDEIVKSPINTNCKSFYETLINYSPNCKIFQTFLFENLSENKTIDDWNIFKQFKSQIIANIQSFSVVRIKERKAILVMNDNKVYTLRLNESIESTSDKPVIISEFSNTRIKSIVCGMNHLLCLTETHEIYSFGDNDCCQLGNGSKISNYKPTKILEHTIEISCGEYHCLALSDSGKVFAWGYVYYGQTGSGMRTDMIIPKQIKSFKTNIISISCGANHCLDLLSNGELYGWGDNRYGQLCAGNTKSIFKPTIIDGLNEITISAICCGQNHSLLLTVDHSIYSFGRNNSSQFGNSSAEDHSMLTMIETNIKFVEVSTLWTHDVSAGLSQTGKYYVWGKCGDQVIKTPMETEFNSFDEILVKHSTQSFFAKQLH